MTSSGSPFPPAAGARILSLGGYQPGNVVTNDDLAARVDTSDEWIRSRVGIVSRRFAGPEETVTDMAFEAGAKALAGSGCKDVTLYTSTSATGQALGQVFKFNLSQIGCNVTVKLFQGFQLYVAAGTKGEPFDAAIAGWNQDYPDPYDFIDILLNGNNIHDANNNNLAYLNVPALNKRMNAANRLTGAARYNAYGQLDVDITKNYAPWASYDNRNDRSSSLRASAVSSSSPRTRRWISPRSSSSKGATGVGRQGIPRRPTGSPT